MHQNEQIDKAHDHWMEKLNELPKYYKINKYIDRLFDNLPYFLGWGVYNNYYNVKRFIITVYQKVRYGVSDEECWSLDYTISKFILSRLKHFKRMKRHGHPVDITNDQWDKIIDELIWTFEYLQDPEKFNPFPESVYKSQPSWSPRNQTDEQKRDLKVYMDMSAELEERKNKGLELFVKYYSNLWD
jgi:hypothetical protein